MNGEKKAIYFALLMAHRYLYYVKVTPVLSDREYDSLEEDYPDELPPGSDMESSYTDLQKHLAEKLMKRYQGTDKEEE